MRIIILILVSFLFPNLVSAFTIVSPKQGAQIIAGSDVKVQVKAVAGEKLLAVKMLFEEDEDFKFNPATGYYEKTIHIRQDINIGVIAIDAAAINEQGQELTTAVKVFVTLPSNVTLTGIEADPKTMFLYKLPEGSEPNDIRIFGTKSLSVGGTYSDGIEREITSSASGTTYTSSDEKIVKVASDGKATAMAPGKAKITIKNGNYEITVNVIVKQKK